jgi:hypothetical protein
MRRVVKPSGKNIETSRGSYALIAVGRNTIGKKTKRTMSVKRVVIVKV